MGAKCGADVAQVDTGSRARAKLHAGCVPSCLRAFFAENPQVAVAFSGGVDSAFLLWAARACGAQVRAYYARTAFQPAFELADARRLAAEAGAELVEVPLDVLADEFVVANGPDRCYWCKRAIFGALAAAAAADGFDVLVDGTNASDSAEDRPGMRALGELGVRSPLRECGLTKADVRELSREAGLFIWDKPSYACLATRVPAGEAITASALEATERAEDWLHAAGFPDVRVRRFAGAARVQLPRDAWARFLERADEVRAALAGDYDGVMLDLEGRSSE